MKLPCPIPYQGSKRKIAEDILKYFPPNVERLVEPFAGSAALTVAAAIHGKAHRFWINDINEPLMRLWRQIILHPAEIADAYERLWREQLGRRKAFYCKMRDRFNRTGDPAVLLYLLSRCVKASVRYNSDGEFNQSPDNRRKGMRPRTKRRHIRQVSAVLQGKTDVSALDYREVLKATEESDLIYMDPPYQGVSSGDPRYEQALDFDEFADSLEELCDRRMRFVVSYDGSTGGRSHGKELPGRLGLTHLAIDAGVSTQATLLGRNEVTVESLYLSPALAEEVHLQECTQIALWGTDD